MVSISIIRMAAVATLLMVASTAVLAGIEVTQIRAVAEESEVSGEVTVVNPETRLLTVRTADGRFEVVQAPPEVERLSDIKIGDQLKIDIISVAIIELQQGRDAGAMGMVAETDVERDAGSKPSGMIMDSMTLYGQITDVDLGAGEVTIRGAETTETYEVEDKSLLTKLDVKKGDGVVVRIRNLISGEVQR
jgi:hypothetical protein